MPMMNANVEDIYFNKRDLAINNEHLHTTAIINEKSLSNFYATNGITKENYATKLNGMNRYLIQNNGKALADTIQGCVYDAIDLYTGRRVIIKASKKNLVKKHMSKYGTCVNEDIRTEAKLLHKISDKKTPSDAGFSKFVQFFKDSENYYLVSEHGGSELFSHISKYHPSLNETVNENTSNISQWREHIRYQFRFIARCVYYLHIFCNTAHLDLSLENTVYDELQSMCRIIDFGLATTFNNNNNSNNNNNNGNLMNNNSKKCSILVGKTVYQSPEARKLRNFLKDTKNDRNKQLREISKYLYDAMAADVWSLGVMLFIMLCGGEPWHVAENKDTTFNMIYNGQITDVLNAWKCQEYVDSDALDLFSKIFTNEKERITIEEMLNHPYIKDAPRINSIKTEQQ